MGFSEYDIDEAEFIHQVMVFFFLNLAFLIITMMDLWDHGMSRDKKADHRRLTFHSVKYTPWNHDT
jgi:hypothetical protein